MLEAPEVPRLNSGGIALCHFCQRRLYFMNGFLNMMIFDLRASASAAFHAKRRK